MICIAALIVLGILGIFSAYHRKLAREAFDCVLNRIKLRECEAGFDRRMKMAVFNKLSWSPRLARLWYDHFELVSWAFVILFFASLYFAAAGIYNLITYGTCDPATGQCILKLK
ncbi:MAG: hypothetical protein HYW26_05495 [Candidatus Aenigmarchaeota archaeon]|nr:hypothetical protein [Candidatus Aenigmarchaeota archaeon]